MRLYRRLLLTRGWSWASHSSIQVISLAWLSMNGTRSALARFDMAREQLSAALSALQVQRSALDRVQMEQALPKAGGW